MFISRLVLVLQASLENSGAGIMKAHDLLSPLLLVLLVVTAKVSSHQERRTDHRISVRTHVCKVIIVVV
jgi:hypothetical protein